MGHRATHSPAVAGGTAGRSKRSDPALHKLEQQASISAEWALSENNRPAKYYPLTPAGRRALNAETAQWDRLSAAINLVVRPT